MKIIKVEICDSHHCPFHEVRIRKERLGGRVCVFSSNNRWLGDELSFTGAIPDWCPLENLEPASAPEPKKRYFLGRRDNGHYEIGRCDDFDKHVGFTGDSYMGRFFIYEFSPTLNPGECVEIEPPEFKVKK